MNLLREQVNMTKSTSGPRNKSTSREMKKQALFGCEQLALTKEQYFELRWRSGKPPRRCVSILPTIRTK